MFGGPFNHTAFNAGYAYGSNWEVHGSAAIEFGGIVHAGARFTITGTSALVFLGAAGPARAQISGGEAGISFGGSALPALNVYSTGESRLTFNASIKTLLDYDIEGEGGIVLDGTARAGIEFAVIGDSTLFFDARALPVREIYLSDMFAGIVFGGHAGTGTYAEQNTAINIILGPGQELVIDTDRHTIFLDGESAIGAYSGAWPRLQPGSEALNIISASGGNVETEIIYAERYL